MAEVKDKVFSVYLWLISIVSLCNIYAMMPSFHQFRIFKGIVGIVMIISEVVLIVVAIKTYKIQQEEIGKGIYALLMITILYNLAHIVYAAIWDTETLYISLFGNPIYQPAFMLPIAVFMGLNSDRFFSIYKCVLYYVLLIIPIYIFTRYMNVFVGMGLLFLLAFLRYIPRGWRLFLLLFSVLYVVFCYYDDARAPALRTIIGVMIFLFSLTELYKNRIVKGILFVCVIAIPWYFLYLFVTTNYSVFEQSRVTSRVSELGVDNTGDTRTFLYDEVFEDLTENDSWILGKGINGTYYSHYFDTRKVEVDAANRKFAEVGFLDFLLKGGIIQTTLYIILLLIAIFRCFFRSNSRTMVLMGLVLLAHYMFLFVEDVPRYDLYNISLWMYMGLAYTASNMERDDTHYIEQINHVFGIQ